MSEENQDKLRPCPSCDDKGSLVFRCDVCGFLGEPLDFDPMINRLTEKKHELLYEIDRLTEENTRLKEAINTIQPFKLRALAQWLDIKHLNDGSKGHEVQDDLRLMADRSENALAGTDGRNK